MSIFKRNKRVSDVQRIEESRRHILTEKSGFFQREAYKALRTNVTFALEGDSTCKVFIVTSSLHGEGKSTTALNLAISYAGEEKRVLVIDADMRRPMMARLLSIKSGTGLSNILLDRRLLDRSVIHTENGCDVILAGDIPPNPSELLGSRKMAELLEELKNRYDIVIIDTPPISMVTDAVVLSPLTDGALFVIREGVSEKGAVQYSLAQLEYAKAKVLGFVLNDVTREGSGYGYHKYGYGRYGYGRYGYGHYGYSRGYGYGYGYSSGHEQNTEKND